MAIRIIDNFSLGANKPLDLRTKFATVAEAKSKIGALQRYTGLMVIIDDDGTGQQAVWWFKDGIEDQHFVPFSTGGGSGLPGKSAYQIWQESDPANAGKSISDFLDSLKGPKGDKGEKGDAGNPEIFTSIDDLAPVLGSTTNIPKNKLTLAHPGTPTFAIGSIVYDTKGNEGLITNVISEQTTVKTVALANTGGSGSTTYTTSSPTSVTLGGIQAGTTFTNKPIQEVLDQLFHPRIKASITSFVGTPSSSPLYQKGVNISISKVSAAVNKGSDIITKIVISKGSQELISDTNKPNGGIVETSGPFVYNDNISFTADLFAKINESGNPEKVDSSTITYTFVDPLYIGILPTDDPTTITTLPVQLARTPSRSHTFNGRGYLVLAYPKSMGALTSIKDQNNFDITTTFIKSEQTLNVASGSVPYLIYKTAYKDVSDGFTITFNK